jgi:hypothetical protein
MDFSKSQALAFELHHLGWKGFPVSVLNLILHESLKPHLFTGKF